MIEVEHSYRSIRAVQQAIETGTTVKDITQAHLNAIKALDEKLNAIVKLNEHALNDAARLDALPKDQRGPLHGVPLVIKDQIETAGLRTAFGSETCKDFVPSKDATLVQKLKDAGAIVLGKSSMPDFAASWFSTSSVSGTTQNPHDLSRDAGGSSSGSGAAVSSGMAVVAIGGDTGGSIRLPSSFCGLVGVRVTPGRISRDGMSSLVTTQDTPGPMGKSVEDVARVLDVIVGFDEKDDFTGVNAISPAGSFLKAISSPSPKGKRLGVLRGAFGSHAGINKILDSTLNKLRDSGAELIDVSIPDLDYYKTFTSLYGTRSKTDIDSFLQSRPELSHLNVEDIVKNKQYHQALDLMEAISQGTTDYLRNPHFGKRMTEQQKFQRVVASIFAKERLDAVVYPTCQALAPKTEDVLTRRWSCLDFPTNTVIASQLLFPAASVPVGMTKDDDGSEGPELPVGLEVLGLPLQEENVLAVSAGVEAVCASR